MKKIHISFIILAIGIIIFFVVNYGKSSYSGTAFSGGWYIATSSVSQACSATCPNTCIHGFDFGTLGLALPHMVPCESTAAEECLCAP